MEEENVIINSGKRRWPYVLLIIFAAIITYYSAMSIAAVYLKLSEIDAGIREKAANMTGAYPDKLLLSDSLYIQLFKERSFLQSKVIMAESDSIYLVLNITDSLANIEISGVEVHRSKISRYSVSNILARDDAGILISMFSTAPKIMNYLSSIKKEPLMITMAPRDTSEYTPDIMPDTSLIEPVSYILELENGVRIYICQEKNDTRHEARTISYFDLRIRLGDMWQSFKRISHFKVPDYKPYIKIWLPRDDAKIIFRALPNQGQIAIYM